MTTEQAVARQAARENLLRELVSELDNIANAKRFDPDHFEDDTAFADWAQSRARHALARAKERQ